MAVVEVTLGGLVLVAARPRPFDVTIIGHWEGYSSPSIPIAGLAVVIAGVAYMLVVPGRPRIYAKAVGFVVIVLASLLRIYLGIDHFTDALFGVILGISIPVAIFRAFAPNDVYPVHYGARGKTAHLDVTGRRGEAIKVAMKDQLGFEVVSMKPVGLEGSGGSTPLKMQVIDEDGQTRSVFAKLYARNHVRADRWYKLGRTMLYGRLEDETPFSTVRRFVEYEDYTLRLLGEYGFSTPAPLGIVEITPEREYLIAMEFFEDAVEISEAEVDDQVIDDGLQLIRKMWDIGLSHRDIKPANLMVQDGRMRLIDVFFVQVRPSPWRQAVDLGNMMLVLALRSNPESVYEKALAYFTPGGAVRGVRGDARRGQPIAAAGVDEGRRSRVAGNLPRACAAAQAHRDPTVEHPPRRAHRHHAVPAVTDRADRHRAVHPLAGGRDICGLRHRPDHAADGTGGPDGDQASVRRRPALGVGRGRHHDGRS